MNTETLEKQTVKLSDLTPEQRKAIAAEVIAEEKERKVKSAESAITYKELSAEFVNRNIDIFIHRQNAIEEDINKLFSDYQTILEIKAMVYGDKALNQDTHTSTLQDGSASITIGNNVSIGFDGTEKIGIQGIKDYITTLADNDDNTEKLTKMVNVLLKPNKLGMLNPSNIIQLNSLRGDLQSETFNENLDIIVSAQTRIKSTMFVSGWKFIELENRPKKKIEFRFSI
ncbi:DUF3164 family protein [Flavobacterium sp.]|uniref:DUF3164 family protein n=1 Tax=Flavobacterium sp. TaxID=239 RepID=UPI003750B4C5